MNDHSLCDSLENPDVALHCGMMLRECIRHEALCKLLLQDKKAYYKLFQYVELSNFDVASDAFATFKVSQRRPQSRPCFLLRLLGNRICDTNF
jgi:hypothetical protein